MAHREAEAFVAISLAQCEVDKESSGYLGRWERIGVGGAACSQAFAPGALPMGVVWSAGGN